MFDAVAVKRSQFAFEIAKSPSATCAKLGAPMIDTRHSGLVLTTISGSWPEGTAAGAKFPGASPLAPPACPAAALAPLACPVLVLRGNAALIALATESAGAAPLVNGPLKLDACIHALSPTRVNQVLLAESNAKSDGVFCAMPTPDPTSRSTGAPSRSSNTAG